MSISSFNKLGGSGREILQVSLLLVAKITSGAPPTRWGFVHPNSGPPSLSFPGGDQNPQLSDRQASGRASHSPLPGPQAPALGPPGGLLGVQGGPGWTSGHRALCLAPHQPGLSC